MKHLVILGGGPGGYAAAFEAVKCAKRDGLDLQVTLVERDRLGGTCLNVGCIPTKTILRTAHALDELARLNEFAICGANVSRAAVDLPALRERKDRVVDDLVGQVEATAKRLGVEVMQGTGRLTAVAPKPEITVTLADGGENVQICDALILATGSIPLVLPALAAPCVWTSDDAVALRDIPESVIIVGGGVIGVEFASAYASFGTKVTVVELAKSLLPGFDKRVSKTLARALQAQGIDVRLGTSVESVEQQADGSCVVRLADGSELRAAVTMSAVGRVPNTAGFGFEEADLAFNGRALAVDDCYRTNIPGIYAIGDVIGGVMLAHAAEHEGVLAARSVVGSFTGRTPRDFVETLVPGCIYTNPEIAMVGMSADDAKAAGYDAVSGIAKYAGNGKALAEGESEGFVQLVADKQDGRLLGAQIVGARAVELIAVVRPFLVNEARVEDITDAVFAHPTLSEVIQAAAAVTESKL